MSSNELVLRFTEESFYALPDHVRCGLYLLPGVFEHFPLLISDTENIKVQILLRMIEQKNLDAVDYEVVKSLPFHAIRDVALSASPSPKLEELFYANLLSDASYSINLSTNDWDDLIRRFPLLIILCPNKEMTIPSLTYGAASTVIRIVSDSQILSLFSEHAKVLSPLSWVSLLRDNPNAISICPSTHLHTIFSKHPEMWKMLIEHHPHFVNYLCCYL